MYNKQLYERMEKEWGREMMISFCEMLAFMYQVMHEESGDPYSEYEYENRWWREKYETIKKKRA